VYGTRARVSVSREGMNRRKEAVPGGKQVGGRGREGGGGHGREKKGRR